MSYLKGIADRINGVENKGFTQELDINNLVPSQNNFYGIREIEELAESIKENGLMHNLVVRKLDDGKYEIISGERRHRALKSLNYEKVPCQVKELSDFDAEIMLIQANVEQRELLPSEKMEGIRRLKAIYEQKKTNGEQLPKGKVRDLIGKDMKLSGVQVGRYQKVDKDLIELLKEKLDKEEITLTQAHTLSSLSDEEQHIVHEEIKDLNSKDHKEEVETLINGIKQPVESYRDKRLLEEMYSDKKINDKEEHRESLSEKYLTKAKKDEKINEAQDNIAKLKEVFEEFTNPRLIISSDIITGVFYIDNPQFINSTMEARLKGFEGNSGKGNLNVRIKYFEKVDEIEVYNTNPLTPKYAYKIADDIFVWFQKKIELN
ncbi:ParB/RepB/Spo0J family partition protein [Clostridium chromiireducens]|uniref:Nucleoid occlusion protein n=1 Tax=Clostridium chromiireducens TaxID=225345 RepID=A0A1V4IVA5_9CLOT|nr:ParB N-terminal domain-containing protein [Clostridium chromiireducens]OPJ63714.1 nucleoid occlusion protein [Clostridium chromiireducens]